MFTFINILLYFIHIMTFLNAMFSIKNNSSISTYCITNIKINYDIKNIT